MAGRGTYRRHENDNAATGLTRVPGDIWQDVRYAARMFAKQPAFATAAIVTLALGIGATSAIFSVVYGVLLKPLPFDEPERLVSLLHRLPNGEGRNHGPDTYLTYRDHHRAFEGIGAWETENATITGRGEPEEVAALNVTAAIVPLLRVQPALGRFFVPEDDAEGSPFRVVLTHGYWQCKCGAATGSTAFTTLKMAEVAPMPSAIVRTAVIANTGCRRKLRNAKARSRVNDSMSVHLIDRQIPYRP